MPIPVEIQDTVALLSTMHTGADVALYLDESMTEGGNYVPTLNVRGDNGFYRFPDAVRTRVAAHFGPNYRIAKARVDEANAARGITPEAARDIVLPMMPRF